MNRVKIVQNALDYIEDNLTLIKDSAEIARKLHVPYSDLQNSFSVMVGYSLAEYIRNRRLYEAAKEILNSDAKIIDIAYKYGYESPDSFSKAFFKFHGVLPSRLGRTHNKKIRVFRPISVDIFVTGGFGNDYRVESKYAFKLIGIPFTLETQSISKAWKEFADGYDEVLTHERLPQSETELAIAENMVGEYGIWDLSKKEYIIAGRYVGGRVPESMRILEFDAAEWAVCEQHGVASRINIERIEEMMSENIAEIGEHRIKQSIRVENFTTVAGFLNGDEINWSVLVPVEQTESTESPLRRIMPLKIVNAVSIVIIIFALIVGGAGYRKRSHEAVDTNVLCCLAEYSSAIGGTEGTGE